MAFIKNNANLVLLFLIILSAAGLVGASFYFNVSLNKVNKAYELKVSQLQNVSSLLSEKQEILSRIEDELSLKATREEEFTDLFADLKKENEFLEKEIFDLEENLETSQSKLASSERNLLIARAELESVNDTIEDLNDKINDLEAGIANRDDTIDELEDKAACLESTSDDGESSC